jgi:hypothetical protein
MRKIVATLVALSIAAAVAAPMAAEARTKKKKRVYHQPYAAERYTAPRNETYQEFLADKRPIGTSNWWQQMDREGRGGQSRAN